ncbi:hypothetical protein FB451DRAFT_1281013 [Mycena latifolia]|nr:hypothetical protein FB451DRAFT_1281013 [Mycena latifolia]
MLCPRRLLLKALVCAGVLLSFCGLLQSNPRPSTAVHAIQTLRATFLRTITTNIGPGLFKYSLKPSPRLPRARGIPGRVPTAVARRYTGLCP